MGKIIEYTSFDGLTYHAESVICDGCNIGFCHCVRMLEDGEKFCKLCFNHRFGVDKMEDVLKKLDELGDYLWETPTSKLKPEVRAKLNFIGNPDKYL